MSLRSYIIDDREKKRFLLDREVLVPNLVINDGSSVTVRTFYPDGAGRMHVTAWKAP